MWLYNLFLSLFSPTKKEHFTVTLMVSVTHEPDTKELFDNRRIIVNSLIIKQPRRGNEEKS